MNKRTSIPTYFLLLLAFSQTTAGQVYTWVDAGGITHFSATLPDDAASGVVQVELPPAPPIRPDTGDDYFSVVNQAARMRARRLENEKLRAERLQAEAEARRARAEELAALETARQATSLDEPRYYPLYLHPRRPGHRPHWRPRPGHHNRRYPITGRGSYIQSRRNDPVW